MAAGELWNRVNIPYPCATSSVHMEITPPTGKDSLLVENEDVLKLLRNKIFQTEIRLLYELMFILNNSYRGNKTFKGLQLVEQCINRLKNMKLDTALQELVELCPNQIQMAMCMETCECNVPSQPVLEWTCLKVLGAGKLLSCTLSRCSKAFILSKKQMKWAEFLILNLVITSMLSRLWCFFRGLLASLSNLYQWLLKLLGLVAQAQPMPYLTDTALPADMADFLDPADAVMLRKLSAFNAHLEERKAKLKTRKKVSEEQSKKEIFEKLTGEATSFALMSASMEEMIQWCGSEGMRKTKRLLTFLRLKCKRMKCLEAAGYNVQRKLRLFRQEVCLALSPQTSALRTFRFPAQRMTVQRRRSQPLRKRFMVSRARTGLNTSRVFGHQKQNELEMFLKDFQRSQAASRTTLQVTNSDRNDDIDDIFAIAGL
uniref:Nucleolus and neural progenitor protein n=1 Tax=Cyprinodon variegatus TaxID=28743 RepID=A0A3Q2E4Q7_CYPVA